MTYSAALKRCLSLLLICSLLCGLTLCASARAVRQPESGEWFYAQLGDADKEAYDAINGQVEKLAENRANPSAVSFTLSTDKNVTTASIFAFFRDHPEHFWVDASKLGWSVTDGSNECSL